MHKFTLTHETDEQGTQATFELPEMPTIEDVTSGIEEFLSAVFGYQIVLGAVVIADPEDVIENEPQPLKLAA